MQFLKKYPLLSLFAAFLLLVSVADPLVSKRKESELENRPLAQRPKMTVQNLLAKEETQKYSYKYEQYVNDQFIGRDGWITLKSVSESALGKLENNGIVYGDNHRMFEYYPAVDERRLSMNVGFLGTYLDAWKNRVPITVAVVPSSYEIYAGDVPAGLQNVDQRARIGEVYAALSGRGLTLDLFPAMEAAAALPAPDLPFTYPEEERPAYYRTDHHWTTYGAYCAYRAFVESRGLEAVPLEELDDLRREVPDFYGTYFSKCKLFSAVPDVIEYYDVPTTSVTIGGEERAGLYDKEKWAVRDKYAAFLWGNNDLTVIRSENNRNHEAGKTSRVLLIKDSYGNSLAPFLTYSYDEVWVVDLRFLAGSMTELMEGTAFDDVLVLYSFMNFSSDSNLTFLNR